MNFAAQTIHEALAGLQSGRIAASDLASACSAIIERMNPRLYAFITVADPYWSRIVGGVTQSGLPIGLQIVARLWGDAKALNTGCAFEQATEWHMPRLDIS